jgi:hypothetical protein
MPASGALLALLMLLRMLSVTPVSFGQQQGGGGLKLRDANVNEAIGDWLRGGSKRRTRVIKRAAPHKMLSTGTNIPAAVVYTLTYCPSLQGAAQAEAGLVDLITSMRCTWKFFARFARYPIVVFLSLCEDNLNENTDTLAVLQAIEKEAKAKAAAKNGRNRGRDARATAKTRPPKPGIDLTATQMLRYKIESALPPTVRLALNVVNVPLPHGPLASGSATGVSNTDAVLNACRAEDKTKLPQHELLLRHNNLSLALRWQKWKTDKFLQQIDFYMEMDPSLFMLEKMEPDPFCAFGVNSSNCSSTDPPPPSLVAGLESKGIQNLKSLSRWLCRLICRSMAH